MELWQERYEYWMEKVTDAELRAELAAMLMSFLEK